MLRIAAKLVLLHETTRFKVMPNKKRIIIGWHTADDEFMISCTSDSAGIILQS